MEAPRFRPWNPSGRLRAAGRASSRSSGAEPAPDGGLIAHCGNGASAPAPRGWFHVATTGASAPDRAVCSVTWGSASADRSIIALKLLLRTPVPRPTGQGSRPPGPGRRRSSEHRALRSTGVRQSALFGAPSARPHRGTATSTLRRVVRTTSPGQGTGPLRRIGHLSQQGQGTRPLRRIGTPSRPGQSPRPRKQGTPAPGARHPALFGAPSVRPRRSQADGALRSGARSTPSGQGTRSSSEHRAPHPTGQGRRRSSEHREPQLSGRRQTALFGAPRAPTRRDTEPDLFGGSAPNPPDLDLATGWAPRPTGQADGALRGTVSCASPGKGPRALRSTDAPDPPGQGPGPPRRAGTPATARAGTSSLTSAIGALRSPGRLGSGLDPEPLRRLGPPISRATGHPASRGRATGDSRVGTSGLYVTHFGGLAVGNRHQLRLGPGAGQDGNGRKATAAVM
jgi:hypothetical protein